MSACDLRKTAEDRLKQYTDISRSRRDPTFQSTDTPADSLSRMCDFICVDDPSHLASEVRYFWTRSMEPGWKVESLEDSHDSNAQRYAVLASTAESLAAALNWRMSLGMRPDGGIDLNAIGRIDEQHGCPAWTSSVPRLDQKLVLYEEWDIPVSEPKNPFSDRNISANAGNIFSI